MSSIQHFGKAAIRIIHLSPALFGLLHAGYSRTLRRCQVCQLHRFGDGGHIQRDLSKDILSHHESFRNTLPDVTSQKFVTLCFLLSCSVPRVQKNFKTMENQQLTAGILDNCASLCCYCLQMPATFSSMAYNRLVDAGGRTWPGYSPGACRSRRS